MKLVDRNYQTAAVDSIFKYFKSGNKGNPLIALPTGCHAKGHLILMADGSLKKVEDILVGDKLMGPDSKERNVLALARGRQVMRKVTPNKGEPFIVNKDHKLLVRITNQGKDYPSCKERDEVITIAQYQEGTKNYRHIRKIQHTGVDFPEKNLPLPAYFVGLLIGDGSTVNGVVSITTMDIQIHNYVTSFVESIGCVAKISSKDKGQAWNLALRDPIANRSIPNRITAVLRELGIQEKRAYEKCLPFDYKTGSRQQRLDLLAGLLDTDGHYSDKNNYFEYSTSSPQLAEDFLFLIKSLGFRGQILKRSTTHRDSYKINVTGNLETIPTLVDRKKARPSAGQKNWLVTGFSVEDLPEDEYYGFTLDGDHLYLDKNFIIHHNTGKSVVIARFFQRVYTAWPNQRVLMLTHVKELIEQNYEKLLMAWPTTPAGVYSAGLGRKELHHKITFAGIQSIAKQAHLVGKVDLIIIDECHLVSPNDETSYRKFIAELTKINPNLKVIGLTATPWRMGHGSLLEKGGIFTDFCFNATDMRSFNWFIDEGYLVPLIPRPMKTELDVSGVGTHAGDFKQNALQEAVDKTEITYAALEETIATAQKYERKSWLIFASGVEHAEHITAMLLNDFDVRAAVVHSKMSGDERDTAIRDFKAGRLTCLVNNSVLTTGFDHPEIDLIVMLRPTKSVILWIQMLGRGTRPVYAKGFDINTKEGRLEAIKQGPKHNCMVLDFARNSVNLGPINDPVVPRKKGERGGEAPVKACPVCETYNHCSVRFCISCGSEFRFEVKITANSVNADLIKKDNDDFPIVEVFKVESINYSVHSKIGKPTMMKVSYHCGLRTFYEYVCFEHEGFAAHKARQWWTARTTLPWVADTIKSMEQVGKLKAASHIRVWVNKKYPEIKAHCFDGSAFGETEACDLDIPPVSVGDVPIRAKLNDGMDDLDDDLPF